MKLGNNEYLSRDSFCAEVLRIFSNSRLYNQPETIYYKCANDLEDFIIPHLNALKDGSLEVNIPDFRRGQKVNRKKVSEKN